MASVSKKKVVTGVKWTALNTLINAIVQPVYRIFLAILLLPGEFAYIAVVMLIVGFARLLNNMGLGEAIVQRDDISSRQVSSVFFFNFLITVILSALLYFLSPLIADYYTLPDLTTYINILIITVFFYGVTSVFRFYLQREFQFKFIAVSQIVKNLIDLAVGLTLVLLGFGVLGFVIGLTAASAINGLLMLYGAVRITKLPLHLRMSWADVAPLLEFSIYVSAKKALTYVTHRVDEIVIGGTLSPEVLGAYFLGKDMLLNLQTVLTMAYSQILLPLFSRLKHDTQKLKETYYQINYYIALITIPMFVGISLTAHLWVLAIFGQEWERSIIVFQVLPIAMIFLTLTANVSTSLLYSLNQPKIVLKIDVAATAVYLGILYFVSDLTMAAILFIYSGYLIAKTIVIQLFVSKYLNKNLLKYFFDFYRILLSVAVMGAVFLAVELTVDISGNLWIVIPFILVLGMVYALSELIIDRKQTRKLIKTFLKK
ncbi:lipopolysaccharide biosynthesis protein [Alkalicoccus halolimnae]|uniref:Lipopolysaccharide biosynthesis protein n=1 Tax=Alkalicoccus halolimnae TaxID=1667239 RepID=A0AAJ8LVW4_9BACI|nr:lipopolysaccharide biosynthesis protein [Alkalicoccus halolimnae]